MQGKALFRKRLRCVADGTTNNQNVEVKGLYKNEQAQFEHINVLDADDIELDKTINSRSEEEPIIYNIVYKNEISKYENTLPIHRKIYDIANMEMYELVSF